jgi:hypothetical protein
MSPAIEQVKCPRFPDHGMIAMRLLAPDERQMITAADGDVFEIDCPVCGKYEYAAVADPRD